MSKLQPWNNGPVYVLDGQDKTIGLRAVKPGDAAERIFKTTELADLFASLAADGRPVRSQHLGMKSGEEYLTASIEKENKEGESFPYAFTQEQLKGFTPKSFVLRNRPGYKGEPQPVLLAFDKPWEPQAQKPTFTRVSAAAEEQKATFTRQKAK